MENEKKKEKEKEETDTGAEGSVKKVEGNSLPASLYEAKTFVRSRRSYVFECTFEYFVSLLMTDAFLSYILLDLGFSNGTVGILSSLIAFAYVFQLLTVLVARKITDRKPFAMLFHGIGCFFFNSLYLLPLLPFADGIRQTLAVVAILGGYFGNYFANAVLYQWGNSFVDRHKRGTFSAHKCMVSLAGGVVIQLGAGFVCNYFAETVGSMKAWFFFAAVCMLVFNLSDLLCLLMMRSDRKKTEVEKAAIPEKEEKKSFSDILSHTFGNKKYRYTVYLTVLYDVALYSVNGFIGVYKVGTLGLSASLIQIIAIAGTASRFFASSPFGKYTDKTSFAKAIELGLFFFLAGMVVLVFTAPGTWWLVIAYTMLYYVARAGIEQNIIDVTYSYVDARYFVEALAFKNVIAGLAGFLTALVSGKVLDAIEAAGGFRLFSLTLYPQQVQAIFACLVTVATILYTHFTVCRQKVTVQ